jgi:hypothetical protein
MIVVGTYCRTTECKGAREPKRDTALEGRGEVPFASTCHLASPTARSYAPRKHEHACVVGASNLTPR